MCDCAIRSIIRLVKSSYARGPIVHVKSMYVAMIECERGRPRSGFFALMIDDPERRHVTIYIHIDMYIPLGISSSVSTYCVEIKTHCTTLPHDPSR